MTRDDLFRKNIECRLVDIGYQVKYASESSVSNTARSGYYRFSIILACTIVEGLLYKIVESNVSPSGVLGKRVEYKEPHHIPPKYSDKKLVLCMRKESDILLSNKTTFNNLIKYSVKNNIVTDIKGRNLDWVMKLRNRIHVQSLSEKDRGYTKKKLDNVFDVINFLLTLLK